MPFQEAEKESGLLGSENMAWTLFLKRGGKGRWWWIIALHLLYPSSLSAPSTSAEDTGGNMTLFCQDGPRDVPFACGLHGACS